MFSIHYKLRKEPEYVIGMANSKKLYVIVATAFYYKDLCSENNSRDQTWVQE